MLDLRERTQTLSAIAGYFAFYGVGDNLLSGRGEPERLSGVPVSENFFDVLGVKPMLGRAFNAQESAWNGPEGGDARLRDLGAPLQPRSRRSSAPRSIINDEPHTVVGVLPASFDFATDLRAGQPVRSLLSLPAQPGDQSLGQHHGDDRPAEARRHGGQRARRDPRAGAADRRASIRSATASRASSSRCPSRSAATSGSPSWVLAGAVAMVMLIVCANLSNLLLARTAARQKEVAIRMALGAGRRRLLAQMLTEGLVLSCSGAVLGLVARGRRHAPADPARCGQHPAAARRAHGRRRARASPSVVALVTGIVFGLAPALQASGSVMTSALKDASRGSTEGRGRTWVRNALVVSEIAFACVLLVGAGLLIRSLSACST